MRGHQRIHPAPRKNIEQATLLAVKGITFVLHHYHKLDLSL